MDRLCCTSVKVSLLPHQWLILPRSWHQAGHLLHWAALSGNLSHKLTQTLLLLPLCPSFYLLPADESIGCFHSCQVIFQVISLSHKSCPCSLPSVGDISFSWPCWSLHLDRFIWVVLLNSWRVKLHIHQICQGWCLDGGAPVTLRHLHVREIPFTLRCASRLSEDQVHKAQMLQSIICFEES